jgi:hypothetical protein
MDRPDGRNLLRPEYASFRKEVAVRNIHRSGLLCSPCHGVEVRRGERQPVLLEKDPEKMCRACHDNQLARGDIHPSGVVARLTENVALPARFPLFEGRLVCTTCHVTCRLWERPEATSVRGGPFQSREDACFQCHNAEGYTRFNPHRQVDASGKVDEKVCLYCHSSVADRTVQGMDKVGFVADLKTYCIGCHEKSLRHPVNVQHVGAKPGEGMTRRIKAFEQERTATFPRGANGEVLCFTCHNPHQEGVLSGKAAVESMYHRLRNTSQYEVCNACHGGGGLR